MLRKRALPLMLSVAIGVLTGCSGDDSMTGPEAPPQAEAPPAAGDSASERPWREECFAVGCGFDSRRLHCASRCVALAAEGLFSAGNEGQPPLRVSSIRHTEISGPR